MSFKNCTVTYEGKTLFEPAWGIYDMAIGEKIVSAFSGPADPDAFGLSFAVPKVKTMKILHSPKNPVNLHELYQEVRDIREGSWSHSDLRGFFEDIKTIS
jgi:phenylalanine-4-hydroxylase